MNRLIHMYFLRIITRFLECFLFQYHLLEVFPEVIRMHFVSFKGMPDIALNSHSQEEILSKHDHFGSSHRFRLGDYNVDSEMMNHVEI